MAGWGSPESIEQSEGELATYCAAKMTLWTRFRVRRVPWRLLHIPFS